MAVGRVLMKVMGKNDEGAPSSAALETEGPVNPQDCRSCFQRSTWRWIVTVVLSLQLLVFVLLTVGIRRGHNGAKNSFIEAPFMFTFKLQRSASVIERYKAELEANLSSHIPSSNMKVSLLYVNQTNDCRYAEVRFQLLPDHRAPYNESAVKKSLVKFFLQQRNLSLTPTTFGQVYDFQINKFPGGLSIVPGKWQKSLRRPSLFNFTLPNSTISGVSSNFRVFKHQLAGGISLQHNETLIARLTNLNGSTVESPVIIQATVFPAGRHFSSTRIRQLALKVSRHRKNLRLNHTLFGRVKDIQLSPMFRHALGLDIAPSPAPSPAPVSGGSQEYTDYSYGRSPKLFYPGAYDAPAPAPVYSIQTGFAKSPDFVSAAPDFPDKLSGGMAFVPGVAEPQSSSSWYSQRLSAMRNVLVATAIALML
ncbi:hypothetical protein SELMODRAFT_442895 [Selaginella moellendorffii]|uniref:DUF7036 domain-containing protein n=1 Tax=Selaginella moellendorffii TaxID=88036 RepID=D8RWY8_SELML|nr:uncharacterized protein LOC9645259 [Selaginella moellendorffii]XP_024536295.1 uncharacterized protein LOC9645259 [Selaginella moellendorffii]EFJ23342.1 hypothetical protein SELMODRAFT_442895 [Selaginella moellendorffii]|eukprot:XP_002975713.1 uncharacterized protein LOC9645259 [Selaginella moellendorffii]